MEASGESRLKKRQMTLKDGRYMIFYTFGDGPAPSPEHEEAASTEPKPQPKDKHRV